MKISHDAEWLEADGLGGFASGTVSGIRTRRYHALLLAATTPPAGRMTLVNGLDAWVTIGDATTFLSTQRYAPDVLHPNGVEQLKGFTTDPWPRWTYRINDTLRVEQELFVPHGSAAVVLRWKLVGESCNPASLFVRPFFSSRDFHGTHHENGAFNFAASIAGDVVAWHPYDGVPGVTARSNGRYESQPDWYRNFAYSEERARELDFIEDLAAPGVFEFAMSTKPAELIFAAEGHESIFENETAEIAERELARREAFPSRLHRAADAYFVRRGNGTTLIAGYPWFGDWGRDTFIALRGLCLATGRLDDARSILTQWAGTVSEGMLPNRFPDSGETPEYNSVDASLWYVVAVHEFLEATGNQESDVAILAPAIEAILEGYSRGTRFGIRLDDTGLLACGEPGTQLTWMDAKIGDWVITPRMGKPVEVQALWLNALWIGAQRNPRWQSLYEFGLKAFRARFWNAERRCLHDVIDCDQRDGTIDASLRPNQIFAVGGLPLCLLDDETARAVVDAVESSLLTPNGLRSLAPGEPGYRPRYEGGVVQRDSSYHQGTVWPWLIGPFVEAWLRVRGPSKSAVKEARTRFLPALNEHLNEAGLGHISEITDAEVPHTPHGCPFQAWSLGELLRIQETLLSPQAKPTAFQKNDPTKNPRPRRKPARQLAQ
ncbi:MAG: amylo-alpha-1,6-glucosidase [Chthoniobacterales bacterium]